MLKTAVDAAGNAVHTLYPLDALEIRRAMWSGAAGDYERSERTEATYLFAHGVRLGRIVVGKEELPSATSGRAHVFLELMDHLGSTGIVVDRETGELVERSTYQGYGGAESDYRAERWKSFREDYRFTGKEEDVEVGLQYFGKRYFAPTLGRWISADPLALHLMGADLNVFSYVSGRAIVAIDRVGLAGSGASEICDHPGPPTPQEVMARQTVIIYQNVRSSVASATVYLGLKLFGASLKTQADVLPIVTNTTDVASSFLLARQHFQDTMPTPVRQAAPVPAPRPVAPTPPPEPPAPPAPSPPARAEPSPAPAPERPQARANPGGRVVAGRTVEPRTATASRYVWKNPRMAEGNFIDAELDADGALKVTVKANGPDELRVGGSKMLDDVFDHFGADNIREFDAKWVRNSSFADNYNEYLQNLGNGMKPEDAAWNTWTGRQLKARGFTQVEVPAHGESPEKVSPVFTK